MNEESRQSFLTELKTIANFDSSITDKLIAFIELLLYANKTTNLTSITDFQEALYKHIYDSLIIYKRSEFQSAESIIDIGSGAGIPGIPLAICQPGKRISMLEATQKKVNFQVSVSEQLKLKNINSLWGRAEELAHHPNHRESYDLAIGRAVSAANILAELTLPFVRIGGFAVFYKGQDYQNELQNAYYAIHLLGGQLIDTIQFELPLNYGTRSLIIIQKTSTTPSTYPRKAGSPQKKPLEQ